MAGLEVKGPLRRQDTPTELELRREETQSAVTQAARRRQRFEWIAVLYFIIFFKSCLFILFLEELIFLHLSRLVEEQGST